MGQRPRFELDYQGRAVGEVARQATEPEHLGAEHRQSGENRHSPGSFLVASEIGAARRVDAPADPQSPERAWKDLARLPAPGVGGGLASSPRTRQRERDCSQPELAGDLVSLAGAAGRREGLLQDDDVGTKTSAGPYEVIATSPTVHAGVDIEGREAQLGHGGRVVELAPRALRAAVDAASPGDVVVVCTGTYNEDVKLTKPVRLLGTGSPSIDATGQDNGILVVASGATVEGLTVENAIGEGILAVGVHNVTIEHNVVQHNDLGTPTSSYLECQATQGVPGDCGEGLHLMGVADSQVLDNVVRDNSGGILLTDETGPTHGNLVEGNVVDGNAYDCGITMPSHNGKAVTASGTLQPTLGGVYDNTVTRNFIFDDGLADGAGAGVLIADPFPGTADYNNTVSDNTIEGNGNPGVTMHEHAPGTYLGGNVITGNTLSSVNGLVHQAA